MVQEVIDAPTRSLVRREEMMPREVAVINREMVKAAIDEMRSMVRSELRENVHFAKRGNSQKPSLEKPGAEVIFKGFLCRPAFEVIHREMDHRHKYAYYEVRCQAIHVQTGAVLGEGIGSCDTSRDAGGDKQTFAWQCNAALKMAEKSAMIATAVVLGCVSEFFTQDMGDVDIGAFADHAILEVCPAHNVAWKPGKYGPYHGMPGRNAGFCNQKDVLRDTFKEACTAKGMDGKAAAEWLKGRNYGSWTRLSPSEQAKAIEEMRAPTRPEPVEGQPPENVDTETGEITNVYDLPPLDDEEGDNL